MRAQALSALDLAIVLAFVVYCVAVGLRARGISSQSLDEYFLAGRTLSGWKAGLSMAATQFAADTPLLVTGLIATAGIFSLWRLWIYALSFLLLGFLLAGAWRRARVLTDAELAELRYGSRLALVLRATKAIYFGTIFNCTVIAMVLLAAARIAEPFLAWDRWLAPETFGGVVEFVRWTGISFASGGSDAAERSASNALSLSCVLALTTAYSTTGGLRAVVQTDVIQFVVAMTATLVYAVVVVTNAGGLSAIPVRLDALYGPDWTSATLAFTPDLARDAGWIVLGTIAVQWIAQMNADGTGYLAQRTMACRSDRDARHAVFVFVVAQVLLRSLLWIAIGLALLVLLPLDAGSNGDSLTALREGSFVDGIVLYLPSGARGLMVTGLLAALASTLDTHLNWGASYWTNDIYRRLVCDAWLGRRPSPRELVWVARASNGLVLALALVVLSGLDTIQQAWKTSLLFGAGMGAPLLLRWLWWRVTAAAELAAIGVSLLLAPLLIYTIENEGARMLGMALATTLTTVAVALATSGPPTEALVEFYRRVRPPGYWGPVARLCAEDESDSVVRLHRGAAATATASLGVFCVLVAAGTALFGSPAPGWLPSREAWIGVLLLAGALSAAGAMRHARRT